MSATATPRRGVAGMMRVGTGRRDRSFDEFRDEATQLENAGPPPIARITLFAAAALLASLLAWSTVARVDEIVAGKGKVVTKAMNIVLSPLATSSVRDIDVRVGDIVSAGQPLAHLDPTFSQADVTEEIRHKASLDAEIDRLATELSGHVFQPATATITPDRLLQAGLSLVRQAQYQAQVRSYDEHIAQFMAQISDKSEQINVMKQRASVLANLETMHRTLAGEGNGSKVELLNAEAARLEVQREIAEAGGAIGALRHQIESSRGDREAFMRKWREDMMKELVTARRDDVTATEQLNKAARMRAMTVLRSPKRAVVLDIADRAAGATVREADTLMTLVPLDETKEIEVSVDAADVGHLKVGEHTRIKLDAFPYQRYGTLSGKVLTVSGDAFIPDRSGKEGEGAESGGKPYYRVRIALDGDSRLRNVPVDFQLIPGMTVSAEIQSGSRRLISYLLYPLMRGFDESFREP